MQNTNDAMATSMRFFTSERSSDIEENHSVCGTTSRDVCVCVCVIACHVRRIDMLIGCNITGEMGTSACHFHQYTEPRESR